METLGYTISQRFTNTCWRSHPMLTHQRYCQLSKSCAKSQSHRDIIFKPIQITSIKFPPCHKKFHGWTLDTASPGLNLTRCCFLMLDNNAHTCLFLWEFCEAPFSKKNFHSSGDLWGLCTTPPATAAAPPPTPTPTAGADASASATALSCSDLRLVSFGSPVMTPRTPSLYLGRKVPLIMAQKEAPVIKVCHVELGGRNWSCVCVYSISIYIYMEPVCPRFLGFNPPRPKALSLSAYS